MRAEMASNVSEHELQKLLSHADHEGLMHIILVVLASCTDPVQQHWMQWGGFKNRFGSESNKKDHKKQKRSH